MPSESIVVNETQDELHWTNGTLEDKAHSLAGTL